MTNVQRIILLLLVIGVVFGLAPGRGRAQSGEPIPVYVLQGEGASSPLAGRYVDSVGVVTGVGAEGFYLQDPAGDGRTDTSDGIYVYTRERPAVQPGDCVTVRHALIDEFYEKSELSRAAEISPSDLCRLAPAPAALPAARYDAAPAQRYEALEGMVVTLPRLEGVIHGPTKRYATGEAEVGLALAAVQPYLTAGRVYFDEPRELAQLLYVSGALGVALPDLHHGDRVRIIGAGGAPATAILDYNFGKYQFLLLPGAVVETAPAADRDFTLCSYNLMGMGSGTAQHPDPADYDRELRRRAATISTGLAGCTVIGLQEAGQPADAERLAALLTTEYGLSYTATALPSPQSSDSEFPLTNALLTRTDRVQVVDAQSLQGCTTVDYDALDPGVCALGEFPLFDRPPLVVNLSVQAAGAAYPLTVIVNHWKSKAGDEAANLPRRLAQAQHVAGLVQARLTADADAAIAVLGDFNDYYGSEPLAIVATAPDPDLVHLYDRLPPLARYSYIFNGPSQTLDHVLVSPALAAHVGQVEIVHLNADFAASQSPTADAITHASDHDPLLTRIWPDGAGWLAGNARYSGVQADLLDADGARVATAHTDARGDFRLWNLAPGSYRLRLSAPPHLSLPIADVAITVVSGENRFMAVVHHFVSQAGAELAAWTAAPSGRE